MNRLKLCCALVLGMASAWACAQASESRVPFVSNGCICVTNEKGRIERLTTYGKDRAPVLSPGGKSVVFLRKSRNQAILVVGDEENYPGDDILADQVWIVDLATKKETLVVPDCRPSTGDVTKDCEQMIAHIDEGSLCFSPDGARIYFITSAWVTSGALHYVNLKNGTERFLMGANSVEVVAEGEYKGYLIVNQHRYFLGGGSYDWFWLCTPDGQRIDPVGDVSEFKKIYQSNISKTRKP